MTTRSGKSAFPSYPAFPYTSPPRKFQRLTKWRIWIFMLAKLMPLQLPLPLTTHTRTPNRA